MILIILLMTNNKLNDMPDCIWERIKCPPVNKQSQKIYNYIKYLNRIGIEKLKKKLTENHNIYSRKPLNIIFIESTNIRNWDLSKINILNITITNNNTITCFLFDILVDINILGDLVIRNNKNLTHLPESFGRIKVGRNLDLASNSINILPSSFGNIEVGRDLLLYNNGLKLLPNNFGNIKVGHTLHLGDNNLSKLPESFGKIKVHGDLLLSMNPLNCLPKSFGNIEVGCSLAMSNTKLQYLPKNFGSIKIGCDLHLTGNNFQNFPKSFENLNIKTLILCKNPSITYKYLPTVGKICFL